MLRLYLAIIQKIIFDDNTNKFNEQTFQCLIIVYPPQNIKSAAEVGEYQAQSQYRENKKCTSSWKLLCCAIDLMFLPEFFLFLLVYLNLYLFRGLAEIVPRIWLYIIFL